MAQLLIPIARKRALLFAGFLVLYEFLTYIANDIIMPAMLDVVHSFNASESMVASSLTVYILGGASLQLISWPLIRCSWAQACNAYGSWIIFYFYVTHSRTFSMDAFLRRVFFKGWVYAL